MAAQLAFLSTVTSRPYFLKNPFFSAMTRGEQSVRAIIPIFKRVISGPAEALVAPEVFEADSRFLHAIGKVAASATMVAVPLVLSSLRRETEPDAAICV